MCTATAATAPTRSADGSRPNLGITEAQMELKAFVKIVKVGFPDEGMQAWDKLLTPTTDQAALLST